MRGELRAPDPTLTELCGSYGDHRVLCSDDTSVRGGMIAHLPGGTLGERVTSDRYPRTSCGMVLTGGGFRVAQARHVRWHAIPCRECFPDAPAPGTRFSTLSTGYSVSCQRLVDPNLSWQVSS